MSPATDEEFDASMARLARGDRSAFPLVFERLWPQALALCRALLGDEADAADAAQEALRKVFERAQDYDPSRPALPWALAIAGWECRTVARKRLRRGEVAEVGASPGALEALSAEEALAQRELEAAALAALGQLSALDRQTLLSTYWDEATSAGGATVRKRRQRALERLRQLFWRTYGLD